LVLAHSRVVVNLDVLYRLSLLGMRICWLCINVGLALPQHLWVEIYLSWRRIRLRTQMKLTLKFFLWAKV